MDKLKYISGHRKTEEPYEVLLCTDPGLETRILCPDPTGVIGIYALEATLLL